MNLTEYCTGIADAIREQEGSTALIPASEHADRIKAIQGGTDTSQDTVTAETLVEGYTAHDASGNPITGTNPYEKTATDSTVTTQADLIAQIQSALEGKAGGGIETATLSVAHGYGGLLSSMVRATFYYVGEDGTMCSVHQDADSYYGETTTHTIRVPSIGVWTGVYKSITGDCQVIDSENTGSDGYGMVYITGDTTFACYYK